MELIITIAFQLRKRHHFVNGCPLAQLISLEEPIRAETLSAYQALRAMTDIPFAIGEEFSSKWEFLPYLEQNITQFARIDVCNVGGLTEAMKVASLAETHYIDLMPHNPLDQFVPPLLPTYRQQSRTLHGKKRLSQFMRNRV